MQQTHHHQSIWQTTATVPQYPPVTGNLQTSVVVVGAGIAGLTTAYHLAQAGVSVIVVDDGPVGGGETGRTTAHLTCMLDKGYAETLRLRGVDGARAAAASHKAAIDRIEQIVTAEQIACDFLRVDGYLCLGPDDTIDSLQRELVAAHRAGLADVRLMEQLPLNNAPFGPALRFPHQGQFHVLRYLNGLCQAIERMGGQIFCGTRIAKVHGGTSTRLETANGFQITANATVLATNAPINDALGYSSRVFAYRTYVIGARIPHGSVPPLLLYDTAEPYHYVRIQNVDDHDLLIVGGEDHRTGLPDDLAAPFAALEHWTREHFPQAGEVTERWSGQVLNTLDGLALIGPDLVDTNVFVITGDTGMGMTHGTLGGMISADLILGRPNPWADLYDPGRLPLSTLGDVISEGVTTVAQLSEWISGGDVRSVAEISTDSGGVIGVGLAKTAVYRDAQGSLHACSAVCTHTGCIVGWNDVEKSWDCPCHGSRYDAFGRVINGPAKEDLHAAKVPIEAEPHGRTPTI
jgi:glycine/D-amino acid oxidase-like deaminating enzyme/nitrite reductase/ring-hydroxylating ferredoxin subunit